LGWNRGRHCLGHYLVPDRLTAQRYRDFLETVLLGCLEDMTLTVRQCLWFQNDGAPANSGEDVRQWLKVAYSRRWTGCRRPIAWPLRSPDLTPMDFVLWGHLKEHVYAVHPTTIEDVMARLQVTVTTVDSNMLRCVRENAVRRTAVCLEMDGGRFERLL
jgi:hypothetical protein